MGIGDRLWDALTQVIKMNDQVTGLSAQVRDLATAHLHDVHARIKDLRAMERVLKAMVIRCADGTLPDCPLIDALFRAPESRPDQTQPRPAS